ncbi:LysR family transcriptional regulator substrate-binding protein [Streptomyces sp. NPDC055134]
MPGQFHRAHPKVAVHVVDPEHNRDVVHMVETGQCELGLVDEAVALSDLCAHELPEQEMYVILPPDHPHPESDTDAVTLNELAGMDLVVTPRGTATRDILEDVCAGAGSTPRIVVETRPPWHVHQSARPASRGDAHHMCAALRYAHRY